MCLILFGWAIRHVATLRPKMFRLTRPKISQNLFRLSSGFITYIQGSSHWIRNVGQLTADGTKFECLANAICNAIVMFKYRNSYAIVTNLHTIKIWSTNLEYVRCTNLKLWWTIRICLSCKFQICRKFAVPTNLLSKSKFGNELAVFANLIAYLNIMNALRMHLCDL